MAAAPPLKTVEGQHSIDIPPIRTIWRLITQDDSHIRS